MDCPASSVSQSSVFAETRQRKAKASPYLPVLADNLATMRFDYRPTYREPNAEPVWLGREEAVEELRDVIGQQTWAAIL